jgi:hypothetical protein
MDQMKNGFFSRLMKREKTSYAIKIEVFLIIVTGIFLRIWQYSSGRSLWFDEAMLATNIVNRSLVGITQPLDYNQGAPVGFLLLEKIIFLITPTSDYSLRFVPLVSGIIAFVIMYYLTKEYFSRWGSFIALGLFGLSSPLVYYSSEVKQYSTDVIVSVILIFFAERCFKDKSKLKNFIILGAVGAVSIFMSHPALFVMFSICLVLTIEAFLKKDIQRYTWLGCLYLFWVAIFAFIYFISLRSLAENQDLSNYWSSAFMPMPPWSNIGWFHNHFSDMLTSTIGPSYFIIAIIGKILFVLGCLSMFARSWKTALILTMPILVTMVVSSFGKYAFGGRLLLFLAPMVTILIAEGLERFYQILHKRNFSIAICVWVILGGLLLYTPAKSALATIRNPNMKEDIKPLMAHIRDNRLNQEGIYVYYGARPAFEYYSSSYGIDSNDNIIYGAESRADPEKYILQINNKLNVYNRVWFLFSHDCSWCKVDEMPYILREVSANWKEERSFKSQGASCYLFNTNINQQ